LEKPRREVDHTERTAGVCEGCLEDVGIWDVPLYAGFSASGRDGKVSTVGLVQKSREHRLGIETRETAPNDVTSVVYKRGKLAVPNDA
jgi:hypothetical protein